MILRSKLVLLIIVFSLSGLDGQVYYNKLFTFDGLHTQLAYNCAVKDDTIYITGAGKLPPESAQGIFYVEITEDTIVQDLVYYEIDSSLLVMNVVEGNIFVDDNYVSAFKYGSNSYIYKVKDGSFHLLDTIYNEIDNSKNSVILGLNEYDSRVFINGNNDQNIDGKFYSHPFIYELDDEENKLQFIEYRANTITQQIIPYSDSSYVLFRVFTNPTNVFSETWTQYTIIEERDKNGDYIRSWSSEQSDLLGKINSVYYHKESNSFYIAAQQVKSNNDQNNIIDRACLYKFTFENDLEWMVYPAGEDWDNQGASKNSLNKVILANEEDAILVAGKNYSVDQDTIYQDGIISKYDFEGNNIWSKSYTVFDGGHELNDIESYGNDGYVAVGTLDWVNIPAPFVSSPTWVVKIDNKGEFDNTSSTYVTLKPIDIKVYPNPTHKTIHIDVPEEIATNCDYSIFDMNGNKIASWKNQSKMDITFLNKGFHFLTVRCNDVALTTKFFVSR